MHQYTQMEVIIVLEVQVAQVVQVVQTQRVLVVVGPENVQDVLEGVNTEVMAIMGRQHMIALYVKEQEDAEYAMVEV